MKLIIIHRRIRHPFFPDFAAVPAAWACGSTNVMAGSYVDLTRAAGRGVQAHRAVYVLTHSAEPLTEWQRDELWDLFQVPVYALMLDRDGNVLACECEAHNGLHLAGTSNGFCSCGRSGAKVIMMQPAGANAAD
jgi:hypothetical protein